MTWVALTLLVLTVCAALWAVLTPTLLIAAIALAAVSALLSMLMAELGAQLAAVFELSVCAGLITVVFVSAISLTQRLSVAEEQQLARGRMRRFIYLPLILGVVAAALIWLAPELKLRLPLAVGRPPDVNSVLWITRRSDLLGQLLLILAGVFGVVVLFKGWDSEKGGKNGS